MPITYRCNICGTANRRDETPNREVMSCTGCKSSVRQRTLFDLVMQLVHDRSLTAAEAPPRKDIAILGCSESANYTPVLGRLFTFTNTYYDRTPRLDLIDPAAEFHGSADIVICSEVLEHVEPPVARAFQGLRTILKPGGATIITVPFDPDNPTVEHYPDACSITVVERNGGRQVDWVDARGETHTDPEPVFHGGVGLTLEMRLFGLPSLLEGLRTAGFEAAVRHYQIPESGIFWPHPWSVPVIAVRR